MIKKILLVLVVILAGIAIVAAFQAPDYRVVRTATFAAPASAAFAQANDLHKYAVWNPFSKDDPTVQYTYSGPNAGTGAVMMWNSTKQSSAGSMTIVDARPAELVHYRLDFTKPFADTASTELTFKPQGNQTVVTWTMEGKKNYLAKVMCLFVSMDKMIGGYFETGLVEMKGLAEAEAKHQGV